MNTRLWHFKEDTDVWSGLHYLYFVCFWWKASVQMWSKAALINSLSQLWFSKDMRLRPGYVPHISLLRNVMWHVVFDCTVWHQSRNDYTCVIALMSTHRYPNGERSTCAFMNHSHQSASGHQTTEAFDSCMCVCVKKETTTKRSQAVCQWNQSTDSILSQSICTCVVVILSKFGCCVGLTVIRNECCMFIF